MRDFSDDLAELRRRLDEAETYLRIDELRARLPQLETEAGRPDLWDDQERAKEVNAELAAATDDLGAFDALAGRIRSEEHTSELQSLMRISSAVFCLKHKTYKHHTKPT